MSKQKKVRRGTTRKSRRYTRLSIEPLENRLVLTTFWVSPLGSDGNPGTLGQPFATIQRAVDEADESVTPGADQINVRAGTYVENIDIDDADPLTIEGRGSVIIDGNDNGNVIDIFGGDITLKNLEITGGFPTLTEFGDGINFDLDPDDLFFDPIPGTALVLDRVSVHSNGSLSEGAGVITDLVETVEVKNSEFLNNVDGLVILVAESTTILNSEASDNVDNGLFTFLTANLDVVSFDAHDNGLIGFGSGLNIDGDDVFLKDVHASGNGTHGLLVEFDTALLTVINSSFNDNLVNGIDLSETDEVVLQNVNTNGNGNDGINYLGDSGSLTLKSVRANGNIDDGLETDTVDDVIIEDSQFNGNGDDGINVDFALTAFLDNVLAFDNGDDGVDIDESLLVTILNARSVENTDDGFDLDGDGDVLIQNSVATGNDAGISLDGGTSVELINVSATDNLGNGIQIFDFVSATLNRVVASRNVASGLEVSGAVATTVDIIRSTFSSNGEDGIQIRDAGDILLQQVYAQRNVDDGVDIDSSGIVTLINVVASLNGDEDIIIT